MLRNTLKLAIPITMTASLALAACQQRSPLENQPPIDAAPTIGSGQTSTQNRPVNGIQRITHNTIGELSIRQSNSESLTVEAEDNLQPLIETTVQNGTLEIRVKANTSITTTKPVKYTLTVKTLEQLSMNGTGISIVSALNVPSFTVVMNGAGSTTLNALSTNTLTATLSGAGSLNANGKASTQNITLNGAGRYRACQLEGNQVTLNLSGAGGAVVNAKTALSITRSGVGSVQYVGDPTVTKSGSGLGSITKLNACPSD